MGAIFLYFTFGLYLFWALVFNPFTELWFYRKIVIFLPSFTFKVFINLFPISHKTDSSLHNWNPITYSYVALWYSGEMNGLIWNSFQSKVWLSKIESLQVFSYLLQLSHKATVTLNFNSEKMFSVLFQVLFLCTSLSYFGYSGQTNWQIWSPMKNSCSWMKLDLYITCRRFHISNLPLTKQLQNWNSYS